MKKMYFRTLLYYVVALIHYVKTTSHIEKDVVLYWITKIFDYIDDILSNEMYYDNGYYTSFLYECIDKMNNILEKYKNYNYIVTNDLETIKRKINSIMSTCEDDF